MQSETPMLDENVFGQAKKWHLELAKLNPVDHGTMISLLNTMFQRRMEFDKFAMMQQQEAHKQAMEKARNLAMGEAEAAQRRQEAQMDAKIAAISGSKPGNPFDPEFKAQVGIGRAMADVAEKMGGELAGGDGPKIVDRRSAPVEVAQ